jgi:RNA polymerase sigma-70 factor (ECF subfamily)
MYVDASRVWPTLAVTLDEFDAFCEGAVGTSRDSDAARYAAELLLCCACAQKDRNAMAIAQRELAAVARSAISRVNGEEDFVQDTLQTLWDELFSGSAPKIASYSGRGPLKVWLRIVATRTALDRCRAERRAAQRHVELVEELAAATFEVERSFVAKQCAGSLQEALRSALARLSSKDRNVLRLHIEGRCGIDEIGRIYGVHRATAARWLERARSSVFDEVRARFAAGTGMTPSDFRSVARELAGNIELSWSISTRESVH